MSIHNILPYINHTEMKDVYEFGVCTGNSLITTFNCFNSKEIKIRNTYGFDSFIGLPEEKQDALNEYIPGDFSAKDRLSTTSIAETKQKVFDYVSPFYRGNELHLIDGFFENSLTDDIVQKYNMLPASFVNIDCDIYTSTYQCLDFMFRNNLIVPGTLVRFDDWGSAGYDNYQSGESRAFKEISQKYNAEWFLLDSINLGKPAPECIIVLFQLIRRK